jgi:hypothetical protein
MYFRLSSETFFAIPGRRRTCFIGNGRACEEMRSGIAPEGPRCCARAEVTRSELEQIAAPDAAAVVIIKERREMLDMRPPHGEAIRILYTVLEGEIHHKSHPGNEEEKRKAREGTQRK